MRRMLVLAIGFVAIGGLGTPALAGGPLRVCLQSDDPPLSSQATASGFDVALSRLIAERLGRTLAIQWFTTRRDPDSNPPREASALVSDGRCELVAGYPLVADDLGHLDAETGTPPPFAGARPDDRRRRVKLGELIPTLAYRFDALTVILSPGDAGRRVRKLADLANRNLGVETHSLADLIAMSYAQGRLAERVVHFPDARALFGQLEDGRLDAALVGLHQFDAWRLQHPGTRLAPTGYTHSVGFNIGFVGLPANRPLIADVNAVLSDLMSHDGLAPVAAATGLTYLAPRSPDIAPGIPLAALTGD